MSTNEIPTDVTFTPADVEAGAKPQRLRAGWRQWLITGAERSVSKDNGYLMITLSTRALAVEGDPTSIKGPNVRNNIVLPLKNPSRDDHRPPNTAGICHATLRALYPDEIPDYPRRVNGKLTYLGQTIDAADEALARMSVTELLYSKLRTLWRDPEQLIGHAYYAEGYMNGDFFNQKSIRGDKGPGVVLVSAEAFYD